jgi:hypothetical protein
MFAGGAYLAERLYVKSIWLIAAWLIAFLLYGLLTHRAWMQAWKRREQG